MDSEGSGLAREMDQVQQLSRAKVLEVSFQRHLDLPLNELSVSDFQGTAKTAGLVDALLDMLSPIIPRLQALVN